MSHRPIFFAIVFTLTVSACSGPTRSASTAPPASSTPTANVEATAEILAEAMAEELAADYVEATMAAMPTETPSPTQSPTQPPATPLPFADVPWWAGEAISWCLVNELCESESGTSFGSNTVYRLDEVTVLIQKVLYPNEELADIADTFQDVVPDDTLSEEEVQRIEFLYRKGRLKPCQPVSTSRPILCGERTQRLFIAEAFVVAGGWEIPEIENPVCEDVLAIHLFAPTYRVFVDKGFPNPGTRPPDDCLPWENTTKLMTYVWLHHFHELAESGQID